MILRRAAPVFNTRGYAGASLSDIMAATGLEKGGIYNHFAGKDELALEAFDYAVGLLWQRRRAALDGVDGPAERLLAMVALFRAQVDDPPLPGGCPLLNTAVESDDAYPPLRERVRRAIGDWHELLRRTAAEGVESGELRPETDPDALATVIIATLEGAIMLSRLYRDPAHMHRAVDHLTAHIESTVRQ